MSELKHLIYWDDQAAATYLYGVSLQHRGIDDVYLQQQLAPSGTLFKTWSSVYHYQAHKQTPQLPLLEHGSTYMCQLHAQLSPENSVYIQVTFYDRYQRQIDFINSKTAYFQFTYPENAHSYRIALMNAGMKQLHFQALSLEKVAQHTKAASVLTISEVYNRNEQNTVLTVVFVEAQATFRETDFQTTLAPLENVIFVQDDRYLARLYAQEDSIQALHARIQQLTTIQHIHFVGYGPISNVAALYHTSISPVPATCWYSQDFFSSHYYQTMIDQYALLLQEPFEQWLTLQEQADNVIAYAPTRQKEQFAAAFKQYKPILETFIAQWRG